MSKKSKKEVREIDEQVWNDLKARTLDNIESLLTCAKILLEHHNELKKNKLFEYPYVSAGLYTYAIEEFGKLLILESYIPENNKVRLEYDKIIDHCTKFQIAFEHLPLPCQQIAEVVFKENNPKGSSPFGPWATMEILKSTPSDFEARKTIFYSDLDNNDKIKSLPKVDIMALSGAIYRFQNIIKKRNMPKKS